MAFILVFIPVFATADASNTASDTVSEVVELPTLNPEPTVTSGNLIVVMCAENGQILKNTANGKQVAPVCAAKLMTALVAYDTLAGKFDTRVTVDANALKDIGAVGDISAPMFGLKAGSVLTVKELYQATLISSANDACNALAYFASNGDIASFVEKMNAKALEYGCTGTKFTNTTGLFDGVAYTTVEDVAKIAAAFYKNNELLQISSSPSFTIEGNNRPFPTKNYLLSENLLGGYRIRDAKGMIAGQRTADDGYCLITAAENDGVGYVYVIMEAAGEIRNTDGTREFPEENAYADMKKIFNWYKDSFGYVSLIKEGEPVRSVSVELGVSGQVNCAYETSLEQLMRKDTDMQKIDIQIKLDQEKLTAPVAAGKKVGKASVFYEGQLLGEVNLVTVNAVAADSMLSTFAEFKAILFGPTVKLIIKIIIGIIIAFVLFTVGLKIYYAHEKLKKKMQKHGSEPKKNTQNPALSKPSDNKKENGKDN